MTNSCSNLLHILLLHPSLRFCARRILCYVLPIREWSNFYMLFVRKKAPSSCLTNLEHLFSTICQIGSFFCVSIYRSQIIKNLEDPNYCLQNALFSLRDISIVAVLISVMRDCFRNWFILRWYTCVLYCVWTTCSLFRKNERLDPDEYVEKTKSFVSQYHAFCSTAMLGAVPNVWYENECIIGMEIILKYLGTLVGWVVVQF